MRKLGRFLAALLFALLANAVHAEPITLLSTLSGPEESPPNESPGFGTAVLTLDDEADEFRLAVVFGDLLSPTTAAHIHCCTLPTAGVATELPSFVGFPLGVTSGTFARTFDTTDLSIFNPAFVTANGGTAESAADALFAGLLSGAAYLNIHTVDFPRGEIRGFFAPEPASLVLLGIAALAGVALRRRHH